MKIKAETILETIIASLILSITLFFSVGIVNNLLFSSELNTKVAAIEVAEKKFLLYGVEDEEEEKVQIDGNFMIKKTMLDYNEKLEVLKIDIFNKDTLLVYSGKRLIKQHEED